MRKIRLGLAAALIVVAPTSCSRWEPMPAPPSSTPCQEDEPCWDCHTMGNRVCGPEVHNPNVTCDAFETDEVICVDGRTGEVVR